ncbi:hypothetical protein ACP4OV_025228 [Aristida adscensionis]
MVLSSAFHWWEEWQLRVLVLASLAVQWVLFLSSLRRRHAIPPWFRSLIWLAYLGSDAVAIYALATLFNRRRNMDSRSLSQGGSSILEVVWAPILLMHLGGQDNITAYNIEDNELWRRHVLTAVSQITVATYVFCKSWPGGDKRLLQAAIILFVVGILKCLEKPMALKISSISSLVSSFGLAPRAGNKKGEINSLEDFVREARVFVREVNNSPQALEEGPNNSPQAQEDGEAVYGKSSKLLEDLVPPYKLFADHVSALSERLGILKSFWVLKDTSAYHSLQAGISRAFGFLYTKQEMLLDDSDENPASWSGGCIWIIRNARMLLPWAAVGLFQYSHRHAYNGWPAIVLQYSLIGNFVNHVRKPCHSSNRITKLVLQYVKVGWKEYIQGVATYRKFSSLRGQWTLERHQCNHLGWSLNRAFDESVLLWHIATDMCFYSSAFTGHRCKISNYMMHLLYFNPDMLMPGSRQNLFTTAYKELKGILKDGSLPRKEIGLTERIIEELKAAEGSQEGFIHDAWALTEKLLALGDEKTWEVIEGVWVEMLCFSASRCRGYLHAKALGSGGEFLTYVWLLLSHMGMETLAERLQRPEFTSVGGNTDGTGPSTSDISTRATSSASKFRTAKEDMV